MFKQKKFFHCFIVGILLALPMMLFAEVSDNNTLSLDPYQIQRFGTAIEQIKRLYIRPVTDKELFSAAIRGMVTSLDPHSSYLDTESFKEIYSSAKGAFVGLGLEITKEKGLIKVISPIDDTPAEKSGIRPGDYILAMDDVPIIDVPLAKAIKKMRGPVNSKVKLTVINPKDKTKREVTITRSVIKSKAMKHELLREGFGYIRISHFRETTITNVRKAIRALEKEADDHLKGLILDVRNNPGGLLEVSTEVADIFLDSRKLGPNKLLLLSKGRDPEKTRTYYATPGDMTKGMPIIVLVNQGSASAAEILAAALQDHERAIILGERTFGKGSIQTVLPLDNKTGIKLTTDLYYSPNGTPIQARGVMPDIVVEDLDVQQDKDEALFMWKMHEKDLSGYIPGEETTALKQKIDKAKMTELATTDYQLYEALKLLKTLTLLEERKD